MGLVKFYLTQMIVLYGLWIINAESAIPWLNSWTDKKSTKSRYLKRLNDWRFDQTKGSIKETTYDRFLRNKETSDRLSSWQLPPATTSIWDFLLGTPWRSFTFSSQFSPQILSPKLIKVSRDLRPSDKGILSPTLISLEDTDGLVNIAQSLQFNPELYATVRELITEIKNSLVISIKAKAKVKRSPIWYQLTKEKPIEKNYSRLLKDFHRIWARNLTLQSEWKNWYRENANYSEKDWQEIITLKASVKSFERIFHDCDFNGYNCPEVSNPLILDPKRGSSPTILNPFIFSPYILSPYIFGPFILSPLALTPQILSPSIFSPVILSPLLLSPIILSPQAIEPTILSPNVLSPLILSPILLSPSILSPNVLSPCILSPMALSPAIASPCALCPAILCPAILNDPSLSPCDLC